MSTSERVHTYTFTSYYSHPHEQSRVRLVNWAFQYTAPVLWNSLPVCLYVKDTPLLMYLLMAEFVVFLNCDYLL